MLRDLLVDSVKDYAIFALDPEGRILTWNEGGRRLKGYTEEEVLGKHFRIFYTREDQERGHPEQELRIAAEQGRHEEEGWRVRKDGSRFWAQVTITAIRDDEGRLVGFAKVTRDLTERHETEERLHLLESVIANANDAVVVTEPEPLDEPGPRIVYVNDAFTRTTGYTAEEVIGRSPRLLQGPGTDPATRARVRAALERQEPIRAEVLNYRKDGSPFWVEINIVPVRDETGRLTHWAAVQRETTERRRAEETAVRLAGEEAARVEAEVARERVNAILESITDGFLALDREWRFTYVNRQAERVLRKPRTELIGKRIWEVLPEIADTAFGRGFRQAAEEQRTFDIEEYYRPLGTWLEMHAYPSREGLSVYIRDVTERKEAEDALRERGKRLRLQNEVLLRLSRRRIYEPADLRVALQEITEAAARVLETERVGIWLFNEEHSRIRLIELYERSSGRHSGDGEIARSDNPAYFDALEEERTLAAHDARADPRTKQFTTLYLAPHGITSMLDAPIRVGGRFVGVICHEHVGPARQWTVEEQNFAGSIADLAALAMEAAERSRVQAALRFLAEASDVLASSLDYAATLRTVARLAVPTLADFCLVDEVDETGEFHRVAMAHVDPAKEALLRELERFPPDPARSPISAALRTGKPELIPEVTDEWLESAARNAEHMEILRRLGLKSVMIVPLIARDRKLGAITCVSSVSGRRYGPDDFALAEELARRAAVAIDNARLYEESQAASKAKSDFLAVMSHELRTPLTAITGYADLLDMGVAGPLTAEQRTQVERIKANAGQQLLMIDQILTFSQMEAGRMTVRRKEADLATLAREAAAVARPLAEEKGLALLLRVPEEPVEIVTDPEKVRHILLDLLSNAVKFTERGEVELSVGREDDTAVLRVRDTGIGIAPRDQEKIFEPFVQLEEALTREKRGTGLGLAVARRLARLLGGDIGVESESGKGSTFTVRLPIPMPRRAAA